MDERTQEHRKASTQALAYIQNGIAENRWKVGEKLPTEKELCETLQVSRATVRTAIQQLVGLGMVKSIRGSGTYVCATGSMLPLNAMKTTLLANQSDLVSMLEFRRLIETGAVEYAAQRATTEDVRAMQLATNQLRQAQTIEDMVRFDMEFHTLVAMATKNCAIIRVFEIMKDSYLELLTRNVAARGSQCAGEHEAIATAIAMRSPTLAKQHMTEHLERSAARYFRQAIIDPEGVLEAEA